MPKVEYVNFDIYTRIKPRKVVHRTKSREKEMRAREKTVANEESLEESMEIPVKVTKRMEKASLVKTRKKFQQGPAEKPV